METIKIKNQELLKSKELRDLLKLNLEKKSVSRDSESNDIIVKSGISKVTITTYKEENELWVNSDTEVSSSMPFTIVFLLIAHFLIKPLIPFIGNVIFRNIVFILLYGAAIGIAEFVSDLRKKPNKENEEKLYNHTIQILNTLNQNS